MKHKSAHPLLRLSFGPYSPECVEGKFSELRLYVVLSSSHRALFDGIMPLAWANPAPGGP